MNTLEGNKLIAEFMGLRHNSPFNTNDNMYQRPDAHYIITGIENFKYHSSWDWLMPVVEKIGTMYREYTSVDEMKEIHELTPFAPKEMIYEAVVKFIQWYTTQTPKQ